MAKILTMDVRARAYYPWDEWLDGQARLLEKGRDYACTDESMDKYFRLRAQMRGKTAHVRKHKRGLLVQAVCWATPAHKSSPAHIPAHKSTDRKD